MDLNVLILCAILLDILCLLLRASSMFLLIIVPLQYDSILLSLLLCILGPSCGIHSNISSIICCGLSTKSSYHTSLESISLDSNASLIYLAYLNHSFISDRYTMIFNISNHTYIINSGITIFTGPIYMPWLPPT